MRLLIAATGGFTAYLIAGLLLGVAPTFARRHRPQRPRPMGKLLAQVGSPPNPAQFIATSAAIGLAAWIVLPLVM